MGNNSSLPEEKKGIFNKELSIITKIINNILSKDGKFINDDYNFLSKTVCENYKLIFESELKKQMKINIDSLGDSLYVLPNKDNIIIEKKKEVCQLISSHYIKILYIISMIKYVYSIENDGDLSIAGIIFRNVKIQDNIMEINYCDSPHKNYSSKNNNYKLDFTNLEGFSFFVNYFLTKNEAIDFVKVLKTILKTHDENKIAKTICNYDEKKYKHLYEKKFNKKLICKDIKKKDKSTDFNIMFFVGKDNPILSKMYCYGNSKLLFKMNNKIKNLYDTMKNNYEKNLKNIESILNRLVYSKNNKYFLKDIDKVTLDSIEKDIKNVIAEFYLTSIVDYQILLKEAKCINKNP